MVRHWVLPVVVVLVAGCASAPRPSPSAAPCRFVVHREVLPAWARTGFSDPSPSGVPYVLGTNGDIVGVMFGYPLVAPPPSGAPTNKLLWVSRVPVGPGDTLRIAARADDGGSVGREVPGGPGPSTVDMPRSGCWHLTLTWSGRTDTLDLRYDPAP